MAVKHARFLDPAGLARVGNLPLVARHIVEGFLSGRHRSPYRGFSVEYLDHRAYTPGDELKTVDWRILARTDKYYVKLFEQETNLRATIVLDASRSMIFQGPGSAINKLTYGSYLAAALAYLLIRQNDAVGLVVFDQQVREYLPARAHPTQFRRILDILDKVQPRPDTKVGDVLDALAQRLRRRGMVILISDLLDDVAAIGRGLQHFRHRRQEVLAFHVMDPAELTFPFSRPTLFKDMEGHGRLNANPNAVRQGYLERLEQYLSAVKRECQRRDIDYNLLSTEAPYDQALAAYLHKRARLG